MSEPEPSPPAAAPQADAHVEALIDRVLDSYQREPRIHHLDSTFLPSRVKTVECIEVLRRIVFPGFFDDMRVTRANVRDHVAGLLERVRRLLEEQVRQALRYELNRTAGRGVGDNCTDCDQRARQIAHTFLEKVPELRHKLALDVQAAFDGDPAAVSTDEAVFCYPGLDAVFIPFLHILINRDTDDYEILCAEFPDTLGKEPVFFKRRLAPGSPEMQ